MKIKYDKIDRVFGELIKARDQFCQKCGRATGKLECSHIYSRRHAGTRWDPDNAKLLCFSCHRWWHENPIEAVEWVEWYLGKEKYQRLRIRAHRPTHLTKFDKDMIYQDLKKQLKQFD